MTELEKTKEEVIQFCKETSSMVSRIHRGKSTPVTPKLLVDFEDILCDKVQEFMNLMITLRRTFTEDCQKEKDQC